MPRELLEQTKEELIIANATLEDDLADRDETVADLRIQLQNAQPPAAVAHLNHSCVCNEPANDLMIKCMNRDCVGPTFYHLACVGLAEPKMWWLCALCNARAEEDGVVITITSA
ncbi:hypothetical protein OC835_007748 [Tilletia horrida]|nr:hypothetical protein OC835_007748 [Tilletia horrida]KAK0542750.1 hypothetical protein OC844_007729 [Tilletia horrida]